jgi:hypothetical protein
MILARFLLYSIYERPIRGKDKCQMPNKSKYSGLCETCEHDSTCTLRRSLQLKIIQCEEFSIEPVVIKRAGSNAEDPIEDFTQSARMGLCPNCLNMLSCGFSQARRGVLHCEEYILDEAGVISRSQLVGSKSAA